MGRPALLVLIVAVSAYAVVDKSVLTSFLSWSQENGKSYSSKTEFERRLSIFNENLNRIDSLNAKYSPRTSFGVNKFADMSKEEFNAQYLSKTTLPRGANTLKQAKPRHTAAPAPESWDWRTQNIVTGVKDQGQCGSCWSFSTTGNVEGQWALKTGKLVGLAEQNLVDCDHECSTYDGEQSCDAGCEGGLMWNAFQYILTNNGIDSEESYPYTAEDGTCSFNSKNVAATIRNWTMISTNETDMMNWCYQNGPISVAVDATEWQFYIAGVYWLPCTDSLDHGVLIVGYGTETDIIDEQMDFWIIKNSWSEDWGEDGYIRIERGDDKCGVAEYPCSSLA